MQSARNKPQSSPPSATFHLSFFKSRNQNEQKKQKKIDKRGKMGFRVEIEFCMTCVVINVYRGVFAAARFYMRFFFFLVGFHLFHFVFAAITNKFI